MTPKKAKIILILAGLCIILFGALFWIMTSSTNNTVLPDKGGEPQSGGGFATTTDLMTWWLSTLDWITTWTITDITGWLYGPSTWWPLTILIPGRFYNDWFQQLAQLLKSKYDLTLRYKKIDNIWYYKKIITGEEKAEGIDLYLAPTDRLGNYQGKQIALGEDIAPYVHPIFSTLLGSLVKGRDYSPAKLEGIAEEGFATLIPYALDPLVTLTPSSTILNFENQLDLQDIANFIALESRTNKIKMPILRWLDKNDKKILEQGNESFPNYFIITYNIIHQVYSAGLENNYNIILDTINNPAISKRSYANFKITFNKLLKKNPNCITFPDICIIAYNLGNIKFGFLSDVSIQEKYFWWSGKQITDLTIYNFPTASNEYKVRWRWFVADKNTQNDEAIKIFAKEYTQAWANNSMPLRQDTLSAFNAVLDIQKIQKKYELIFKFESQFSLMLYPANLQEQFLKNTNFISMIQEKNPATGIGGFFEPTGRNW